MSESANNQSLASKCRLASNAIENEFLKLTGDQLLDMITKFSQKNGVNYCLCKITINILISELKLENYITELLRVNGFNTAKCDIDATSDSKSVTVLRARVSWDE
jgi:uncharacterized protein YihD (DUF1040 family)